VEKLKEMDPNLSRQLHPQFTTSKWESLFKVSITGDEDIPLNKRGSGVRRLVLLNFFRAKAEQQGKERANAPIIYAIEEPETSQHPNNQRMLLSALRELSVENQVIMTTHTPILQGLCRILASDISGKNKTKHGKYLKEEMIQMS